MERRADPPRVVHVKDPDDLPSTLVAEGLGGGRPVVVLVGGAGGMDEQEVDVLATVLAGAVVPTLGEYGVLVDGGTDAGVMQAAGRAREIAGTGFSLVGVAATGTVVPVEGETDAPGLEPHHSLVVLVPGERWGDESAWIDLVATTIAGEEPSLTVLANGGEIAAEDAERSLSRGRPVVVLAGTGRLADEVAALARGRPAGEGPAEPVRRIARSALTTIADMHDLDAVRVAVSAVTRPNRGDS